MALYISQFSQFVIDKIVSAYTFFSLNIVFGKIIHYGSKMGYECYSI